MNIHVIIVTYNGAEWIEKCITSILNSNIVCKIKIIDNVSSDDTVDIIRKKFPDITLSITDQNLGFGKANNILMNEALKANADYVFLLNQDAWVEYDTIHGLIDINQGQPEYGILSPVHLNGQGTALDYNFSHYCNEYDCPGFISDIYLNRAKEVYDIRFVNAAFWLISRKCLETIGLFDPIFPHYGEDSDYLNRVKKFGFKIGITPGYRSYHDRGYRAPSVQRQRVLAKLDLLSILKDINQSYTRALVKVFFITLKRALKSLISFKFKLTYYTLIDFFAVLGLIPKIRKSRAICYKPGAFLS